MKKIQLYLFLASVLTSCSYGPAFDYANDIAFRLVDQDGKDLIGDLNIPVGEISMTTTSGDVLQLVRKYSTDTYLTTVPLIQKPDYVISYRGRSAKIKVNISYDYLKKNSPPDWTIGSVWSSNGKVTVEYNHPDHYVYVIPI
jgi:hypothetical protein